MRNSKLDGAAHGSIIGGQSGVAQSKPHRPVVTRHADVKSLGAHRHNGGLTSPGIEHRIARDAHNDSVSNLYTRKRGKAPPKPTGDNSFNNTGSRIGTAFALASQQGQFKG